LSVLLVAHGLYIKKRFAPPNSDALLAAMQRSALAEPAHDTRTASLAPARL
jgi:hypothetical protein